MGLLFYFCGGWFAGARFRMVEWFCREYYLCHLYLV